MLMDGVPEDAGAPEDADAQEHVGAPDGASAPEAFFPSKHWLYGGCFVFSSWIVHLKQKAFGGCLPFWPNSKFRLLILFTAAYDAFMVVGFSGF